MPKADRCIVTVGLVFEDFNTTEIGRWYLFLGDWELVQNLVDAQDELPF